MTYKMMLLRLGRRRRRNVVGALFELLDSQARGDGGANRVRNGSEGERRRQVQVDCV